VDDDNSECEHDEATSGEGKEDRYILVVGFTKEATYQFLRIRQHMDGSIYIEFTYHGNKAPHFSYHPNGEMHTVYFNDKGEKVVSGSNKGPPIAELRGEVSLGAWVVVSPTFPIWRELTIAKKRKTHAMFCFDMSRLTGQLNINCVLLESGRVDLLPSMARAVPTNLNPQFLVITATNPWIVIRAMTV
jgi:hypothetical protein